MVFSNKKRYFLLLIKYCLIIIFTISFFLIKQNTYSENIKKIKITVYNEMGELQKDVMVFKNFVFLGLTDSNGQIQVNIPVESNYTLYFEKKGYQSFMLDITPLWNDDIIIHLISNSNFEYEEEHVNGIVLLNGKPLSNSAFYIKGKGLLREIWTNKEGKFETNISNLYNSFFIYVESKYEDSQYIINYYIEKVTKSDKNDLYISFSNFNKRTYDIDFGEFKDDFNITSLIIYNDKVYYPFIYFWDKKDFVKSLKININNSSGSLFDKYNFFYEIFYTPEKIKNSENKYKFYTQNFKLNKNKIVLKNTDKKLINKYDSQEIIVKEVLPDVKVSLLLKEKKFKNFILLDKNQNVILDYYTNEDTFYIPFSIFDNAYYMSVIYYPEIKDGYLVFLTDTSLTAIYNYLKIAVTKKIK